MRTDQEWRNIIKLQQASSLSIKQFCLEHNISTSNYYKHRQRLVNRNDNATFIKAQVNTQTTFTKVEQAPVITLNLNIGQLQIPATISARFLAEFINGLS